MEGDNKYYRNISAMYYAHTKRAYDLICRRISKTELKNKRKFFLRANREFKEAQDLLLEVVIGTERLLINSKNLMKRKNAKVFFENHRVRAKRLADCLVWAIIENGHTIKELSRGHDPGFIYGKSGMKDELEILEKLNSSETAFALLSDLTTCLRTGDILKIDIDQPGGWTILEIKSKGLMEIVRNKTKPKLSESRKKELARFGRQALRNNLKMFYLKTNIGIDLEKQKFKLSLDNEAKEVYHVRDIELVLSKTMKKGVFVKEVEDGLIYGGRRNDFASPGFQFLIDRLPEKYRYNPDESLPPVPYLGVNFSASHLLPVYLLPIDPDLLFQLVFNFCQLYVYIDMQTLLKKIEKKGFDAALTKKGIGDRREIFVHNSQILKVSKGKKWIVLGQHPFGRVFGEGLSLSSMINIYTASLSL